ncbi:hypothetical protein [Kitasatospora sp. NPDC058478]|uniref:hypothetical protein n=1 Tax=unclassified Kitasatospora TaxID=2633591 RepID=UPI00364F979D
MKIKASAALLGLLALCGLVMAVLAGLFASSHGLTTTGALIWAAVVYTITVAALGHWAKLPGGAVVIRSLLLLAGAPVAVLGALLLQGAAGIKLTPSV